MKYIYLTAALGLFIAGCSPSTTDQSEVNQDSLQEAMTDSMLTIPHGEEHENENTKNCVFDLDTVTDAFLKANPDFSNHTWNDKSKEAYVVLPNNDSLYVHVGGCLHYGVSATLTRVGSDEPFDDHAHWIDEAYWMADNIKGFEPALLHDAEEHKNYYEEMDAEGLFIDFHENDYSLIVDRKDGYTHITLNHYFH